MIFYETSFARIPYFALMKDTGRRIPWTVDAVRVDRTIFHNHYVHHDHETLFQKAIYPMHMRYMNVSANFGQKYNSSLLRGTSM